LACWKFYDLIALVRLYTKYRTSAARKEAANHFHWFLVSLFAAVLVWIWWKNLQRPGHVQLGDASSRIELTPVFRAAREGVTNGVATLVLARTAQPTPHEFPAPGPRPPRNPYEIQVALARQGISSGCLDGALGSQTRAAIRAFQQKEHLPVTGDADPGTKARLNLSSPSERDYTISASDLAHISPVGTTWLAKSLQDRLDYESVVEMVAERGHAQANLIRMLNPSVDWNRIEPGTTVRIPDVEYPAVRNKAAVVRIRLSEKTLAAFDRSTNLLAYFPCSIARRVEKRPVGRLEVDTIVLNPNYRFSPEVFPESDEGRQLKRPLMIPQGPNNPVGVAWIGLNRPGYGIHGTPRPEQVGRTESHGCFRLANWNAEYLAQLVEVGTPVLVEP
jgi:lipoprotein-anchoring transpeptidase ErfK/SrfK